MIVIDSTNHENCCCEDVHLVTKFWMIQLWALACNGPIDQKLVVAKFDDKPTQML